MPEKDKNETTAMSVVTLPLKTEPWQTDNLNKRFELCRQTYNTMLGWELKRYEKMCRISEYADAKTSIAENTASACEENDVTSVGSLPEKARKALKAENKPYYDIINRYHKDFGFTKFGFTNAVTPFYRHFKENISSSMAGRSIAIPMWEAFEDMLYGKGDKVHFKKYDTWNSIATDGGSGLRIINAKGETMRFGSAEEPMFLYVGTPNGKKLRIPIRIPKNDPFKAEMIERRIKVVRLVRKWVKSRWVYSVQLTVEGEPAEKKDASGNKKHPLGEGPVGLYINTRRITACTKEGTFVYPLNEGIEIYEEEKKELQRYMDTSRRISNPDNYNEDGTIKNGIMEDGKRRKLHWTYSKGYQRARGKKRNLERVEAEKRRIERNRLANELLALGDRFVVNEYSFHAAAMRKQKDEMTEKGTPASKKKAGKAIGENAPAMLLTILDGKLTARGKEPCIRISLTKEEKEQVMADRTMELETAKRMLRNAE